MGASIESAFACAVPRPTPSAAATDRPPRWSLLSSAAAGAQGRIFVASADGSSLLAVDCLSIQDGGVGAAAKAGDAVQTIRIDPPLPSEVHQLAVSSGSQYAAVVGTFGVAVAELAGLGLEGTRSCRANPLGRELFATRTSLRILRVAWHPQSHAHLAVLTDDGTFRLFNVVASPDHAEQEVSLEPANSARAVDFAFAEGLGWEAFTVRFLFDDGSVYALCPLVPFGSRVQSSVLDELEVDTGNDATTGSWLQQAFAAGGAGLVPVGRAAAGGGRLSTASLLDATRRARTHAMEGASPALQGPLACTPPAALSPGERAQSLAMLTTGVGCTVATIATSAGRVLTALQVGDVGPTWRVGSGARRRYDPHGAPLGIALSAAAAPPAGGTQLLVIDDVDLELSREARGFPVELLPDPSAPETIFCVHGGGVHALAVVWAPAMARWLEMRAADLDTGAAAGGTPRPELPPLHIEALLETLPTAARGVLPGVVGAASIGEGSLAVEGGGVVCLSAAGGVKVLRPSGAAAAAAAAAAVAVVAAESSGVPAGAAGGTPASPAAEEEADAFYKALLAGPVAPALPAVARSGDSCPLGSGTPEGRQYFHAAKEALRAGHVAYIKRAHGDLAERAKHVGAEVERQKAKQGQVREQLVEAQGRAEATAARLARAHAAHQNIHARLQLLAELEAGRPRPLSEAERAFQEEVSSCDNHLPVLQAKAEELHKRAERVASQGGSAGTPGGRVWDVGTPAPLTPGGGRPSLGGTPRRVMIVGGARGTPIVGGTASPGLRTPARGPSASAGMHMGAGSPSPGIMRGVAGAAQVREMQAALEKVDEAIAASMGRLRMLEEASSLAAQEVE